MSIKSDLLKVSLQLNDYDFDEDGLDNFLEKVHEYRNLENGNVFKDAKLLYKLNDEHKLSATARDSHYNSSDQHGNVLVDIETLPEGKREIVWPDQDICMKISIAQTDFYTELLEPSTVETAEALKSAIFNYQNRRVYESVDLVKRQKSSVMHQNRKKLLTLSAEQLLDVFKNIAGKTVHRFNDFTGKHSRIDEIVNQLNKHFPGEVNEARDDTIKVKKEGLGVITRVVEFKNIRIACMETKRLGNDIKCAVATPQSDLYNYLDVGRQALVAYEDASGYRDDTYYRQTQAFCRRIFHEMDVTIPEEDALLPAIIEEYNRRTNEVLNEEDFKETVQRVKFNIDSQAKQQKKQSTLKDKISKKIKILKDGEGKTIKLNDVTYKSDEIDYEGQKLKRTDGTSNWVYKLMRNMLSVHKIDGITFDTTLNAFIRSLDVDYSAAPYQATIGDVDVERSWNRIEHKNGNVQVLHYINGTRINKNEVSAVLERALCYTDNDNYNAFLKEVSKCSLKFHRYLHTGIDLRVRDDLNRDTAYKIKIPLERRSNINYLDINDELYRVSDTNKIINNAGTMNLSQFTHLLMESGAVQDVSLEDIVPILKEGKQTYEDAVEKSKKLVESTEKLFDIKAERHVFKDDSYKKGYLIEGKIRQYVVEYDPDKDVNEQSHGVYSYPDGRYICIVDKSTDQAGYDKLINRVYALHNDSLVASKISTL